MRKRQNADERQKFVPTVGVETESGIDGEL